MICVCFIMSFPKNSGIIFCILSLLLCKVAYYNDIHISHFMVFQINKNLFLKKLCLNKFYKIFSFFLCFDLSIDHEIHSDKVQFLINFFNIMNGNTLFWNFLMITNYIHDGRCKIVFSMLWDTKEHLPYCLCLLAWLNILASKQCSVMFDCHVSRPHSLELKCKVQTFPRPGPAWLDIISSKLKPRRQLSTKPKSTIENIC